jgi:hypothetical protein
VVNLLAAAAFLGLRGTRFVAAAPVWLVRYLATLGIVYGSAATLAVVTGSAWRSDTDGLTAQGQAVILVFAGICAAIGFATWQRRRDVFPMALLGASWIAISTTMLARGLPFRDIGMLFFVAFWLIAVSTATGLLLVHWSRTWNDGAPA